MRYVKKFLSIVLAFLIVVININESFATNGNFTNISSSDGLSQSSVECMIQDKSGFVWIGTEDGLNRYNGYEYKVYRHDKSDSNSIIGNNIIDLQEDLQGNIWIATSNGVSKIDSESEKITNYTNSKDKGNLSYYSITDITMTSDGSILVCTLDGLNYYNPNTDSFERILDDDRLSSQTIFSIVEDIKGDFWVATHSGLYRICTKNNQIYTYPIKPNDANGKLTSGEYVFRLFSDKKGYVWASTFRYGLYRIDLKNFTSVRYTNDIYDNTSLPGNLVMDIFRDKSGQIWLATNNGLGKFDEKSGRFITYNNKSYDSKSLIQNEVHCIMQDNSGLIWVGTASGISIFNPDNKIKHYKNNPEDIDSISESKISTIYEDNENNIWVGTYSKGINIINRMTDTVTRISNNGDNNPILNNYINYITGYKDEIYVATNYGLNIINKTTKETLTFTERDGISSNSIKNLFVDKDGNLWLGTAKGVNIITAKNKEVYDITEYITENRKLNLYCTSIHEDMYGNIWIGFVLNGGLVKIQNRNGKYEVVNYMSDATENSIVSNSIKSIAEDDLGNLWIGTNDGISKLNIKTNKFVNYTKEDGLPNNVINGVLIDDNNNPWISGNWGISKLDISTNSFKNFNSTDGLQGNEYCVNAHYKNKDGELFFGGTNGLDIFYPEDMKKSDYTPALVFENITIEGESRKDLDGAKLNHDENEIRIKVFLPDYRNTKSITYYYKLENLMEFNDNKPWLTTQSNEINYSALSPSKYLLRVKAMNHNGIMTDEKTIKFTIKPPIWLSPMAIVIYTILLIIIIYYNINRVKYLDNLVKARTKALSKEIYNNNELLKKIVNLEKNKNNYFVNLSHELRTPLNVIYTSEQLITSLNNSSKGIERDKLDTYMEVIKKNTKRLLNLINNLIDGSKIENGNYKVDLEDNDIVFIVEEAALSLKDYIENKGIELIIDPEIEEKIIPCDAAEIERCIVNLVSNAYKFTPKGGKIEVTIKDLGEKTEISVSDTGIGIPKEYHEAVFDRFNQVVDANSEIKGSGLGLTITRQIILLHGGDIILESEIGKGSKFTIIL